MSKTLPVKAAMHSSRGSERRDSSTEKWDTIPANKRDTRDTAQRHRIPQRAPPADGAI
jgi:hypothetical protein